MDFARAQSILQVATPFVDEDGQTRILSKGRSMPRHHPSCAALVGVGLVAMSMLAAATAAAFDSTYTSIAANRCKKTVDLRIGKIEYAVSRICAGAAGYKVYVDEEDLRETLTIGKSRKQALKEPAAHDHYHGFNGYEDTIEWRSAKGAPFAVIVGWSFADQEHLDLKGGPNSAR